MKRKFAVLTVLGALLALAVPASSMASMSPAGHQFEIAGGALSPRIGTSLGSCPITKISGTILAAPANETETTFPISTPTVGTCTAGTTLTLGGTWVFGGASYQTQLGGPAATLTMKFSSLPNCKLSSTNPGLYGIWSNGATSPKLLKSSYHAHAGNALTWSNDGGTCAVAGKTETVTWSAESGSSLVTAGTAATVTDLTSPTSVVVVGANK